jgi:hypothetical protein
MSTGSNNVLVVNPGDRSANAGKVIKQVEVDTLYLTDCSFGGKDMKDLYITTAGYVPLPMFRNLIRSQAPAAELHHPAG